jgi:hypothetical protein
MRADAARDAGATEDPVSWPIPSNPARMAAITTITATTATAQWFRRRRRCPRSHPCGYPQSSRPRFADGPVGPLAPGPAAPGAPPGGEARGERLALGDLASRGGWGFLFRSCVRGRLRPAAFARLRCGARRPGLRREVVGVAGPCWRPSAQRRLALLGPAGAGRPWAPALLAAPEIAKQEPPPAPRVNAPRLAGGRTEKCAREGERVHRSR